MDKEYVCKLIENMKSVALKCGEIMLSAKEEHIKSKEKTGIRDIVTKYDVAVQKTAVEMLSGFYPDAVFFCEEGNDKGSLSAPLVFVIDPIDGTANFANHMNISCVSIGCFSYGVPSAGVVFNPYVNEMYCAGLGTGAALNGVPIHVTEDELSESLVLFGTSPYNIELLDATLEKLKSIFPKCLDVRRCGAAALDICAVAAGKAGLFFEEILALWDYAAAMVILKEAGGVCFTMNGEDMPLTGCKSNIVAGSVKTVKQSGLL